MRTKTASLLLAVLLLAVGQVNLAIYEKSADAISETQVDILENEPILENAGNFNLGQFLTERSSGIQKELLYRKVNDYIDFLNEMAQTYNCCVVQSNGAC